VVDQETLDQAKKFFIGKGVKVSGGITATINERNMFETYCYSDPVLRQKLKEVVEFTARNFDEIILDDFFFTDCKSDSEIQAKGDRSWTAYRLALMDEAGRNLVVGPAKAVNPKVRVIIKYPNWYDHFQYLGFNLETEPKYFDKIYTGTETRDPVSGNQHLQQYHGYSVFRYFENLKGAATAAVGWIKADRGYQDVMRNSSGLLCSPKRRKSRSLTSARFTSPRLRPSRRRCTSRETCSRKSMGFWVSLANRSV